MLRHHENKVKDGTRPVIPVGVQQSNGRVCPSLSVKQRTVISEIASHCVLLGNDTVLKFFRWKPMFRRKVLRKSQTTKTRCVATQKNTSWEDFKYCHLGLLTLSFRLCYRLAALSTSRRHRTVKIYLYVYNLCQFITSILYCYYWNHDH
jgi:hypothetical protein